MSKNIIEIALKAGFINTSNGLESPFIEGEDLTDNLKLFASLLLAQPEHIADVGNMVEPVAWMYEWEEICGKEWTSVKNGKYPPIVEEEYCMRNLRPLYLAPPKREPLSEKEIREGNQSMLNATRETFIKGVRFAEVMHCIGGGE